MSDESEVDQFYEKLIEKSELDLRYILEDVEDETQVKIVDDYFYSLTEPIVFYGTKGKEATYYRNFEQTCNMFRQNGVPEPKKMTAREFFQYLADLTKQAERSKKRGQ